MAGACLASTRRVRLLGLIGIPLILQQGFHRLAYHRPATWGHERYPGY